MCQSGCLSSSHCLSLFRSFSLHLVHSFPATQLAIADKGSVGLGCWSGPEPDKQACEHQVSRYGANTGRKTMTDLKIFQY